MTQSNNRLFNRLLKKCEISSTNYFFAPILMKKILDTFQKILRKKIERKNVGLGLEHFCTLDSETFTSNTREPVGLSLNSKACGGLGVESPVGVVECKVPVKMEGIMGRSTPKTK